MDRSFSSLSAVAQRLMGGWTKWAIWGFTGWDPRVADDYLACRCYKASRVESRSRTVTADSDGWDRAGLAHLLLIRYSKNVSEMPLTVLMSPLFILVGCDLRC